MKTAQRRQYQRHRIQAPCRLQADYRAGGTWTGTTENVSRGGALLRVTAEGGPRAIAPGVRCSLEVSLAAAANWRTADLLASGIVVRVERRGAGFLGVALELDAMSLRRRDAESEPAL